MGRALVLNASFEPLGVVAARRAVVLVLADKADLLHDAGSVVRSERVVLPVPSVIRLRHYVHVPYPRQTALTRRAVFHRDAHACQYCGGAAESIDHVVPRSRGGAHVWENVVAACRRCNSSKGDRLLSETAMRLTRHPVAPRPTTWALVAAPDAPDHWQPYLDPARLQPA